MKLQLDTQSKTIKVESNVKLSELVETLDRLFPKGEWKQFTLETNTTWQWYSPTVVKQFVPDCYPRYTVCGGVEYKTNGISDLLGNKKDFPTQQVGACFSSSLKTGVYNIET